MAGRYYLDSSAYLALLLGERGSAEVEHEVKKGEVCSSVLLVVETVRNLIRLVREGLLSEGDGQACLARVDEDLEVFALRDLTLDLSRSLDLPVVSTPRTLDLIHLRTARWFHLQEPLTRFVTLDQAQSKAAREFGLPV